MTGPPAPRLPPVPDAGGRVLGAGLDLVHVPALADQLAVAGRAVAPALAPEAVDWREIEVLADRWGRPGLRLGGRVLDAVERSLGAGAGDASRWPVSLSHDGHWAGAIVLALAG